LEKGVKLYVGNILPFCRCRVPHSETLGPKAEPMVFYVVLVSGSSQLNERKEVLETTLKKVILLTNVQKDNPE
jgi:hypothetical protein